MKSKDLPNIIFSKYRQDDQSTKIFCDLAGGPSLETIKSCWKMINTTDSIDLAYSSGRPNSWSNWKGQNWGRYLVEEC